VLKRGGKVPASRAAALQIAEIAMILKTRVSMILATHSPGKE
jgi:hypothetical protein